jgi:hypothetical protein
MNKEPYDAGDPKKVQAAKRKAKSVDERMQRGIMRICQDDDCRYVLNQFFNIAGPFRDTYVSDGRDDARNQGWKAAGLWWLNNALLHDPQIIAKMQSDEDSPLTVEMENDGSSSEYTDND